MDISGEELIALAGTTAVLLARCMDNEELHAFCELLGLLKHDIEIIRHRRLLQKRHAPDKIKQGD